MENGRGKAKFKFQPHHLPAVTKVLSYIFKMGMIIKLVFPGCWQGDMATQEEDRFNKGVNISFYLGQCWHILGAKCYL